MKRYLFTVILLIVTVFLISGCGLIKSFYSSPASSAYQSMISSSAPETKPVKKIGLSPDTPIPLGEDSGTLYTEKIKITKVYQDDEVRKMVDPKSPFGRKPDSTEEWLLFRVNIRVDKLDGDTLRIGLFDLLTKQGIMADSAFNADVEKTLQVKNYLDIEFGAVGTVDTYALFVVKKGQARSLVYQGGLLHRDCSYFAIA